MAEKKAVPAKKAEAKAATASASATAGAAKAAPAVAASAAKPAPAPAPAAKASVSAAERRRLVAEAAYFLALKRGFAPGHDVQDWLTAERNVDAALARR